MKCPFCGEDMVKGYVNVEGMMFSENKHKMFLTPSDGEKYADNVKARIVFDHYDAECCPKCKKLIVDISDFKSNIF